jgi:hypothetical protein
MHFRFYSVSHSQHRQTHLKYREGHCPRYPHLILLLHHHVHHHHHHHHLATLHAHGGRNGRRRRAATFVDHHFDCRTVQSIKICNPRQGVRCGACRGLLDTNGGGSVQHSTIRQVRRTDLGCTKMHPLLLTVCLDPIPLPGTDRTHLPSCVWQGRSRSSQRSC